jgi:AcrR family transcriptional regulator
MARVETRPRRKPKQQRSEETVSVILEAASKALGELGLHGMTTNRVAECAGVSIGTLYHYFPGKEALIEALVHHMWCEELALLESRWEVLRETTLEDAIREIVCVFVSKMRADRAIYKVWYSEASHLGQLDFGLELTARAVVMVEQLLQKHRARVRPANLKFAADFAVKMTLAGVRTAARDYPKEIASGELAEELTQMLTRYLVR